MDGLQKEVNFSVADDYRLRVEWSYSFQSMPPKNLYYTPKTPNYTPKMPYNYTQKAYMFGKNACCFRWCREPRNMRRIQWTHGLDMRCWCRKIGVMFPFL